MEQNFTTVFPRRACAIGFIAILLAACGEGDSGAPASNDSNPTPTQNAPLIGGVPGTTAVPGEMYEFVALATDQDGDTLTFSVQNKPAWTTLDATSGRLAGMPGASDVGITSGIVLSVTDGHSTASLPAFSILVNTAPEISGTPSGSAQVGVNYSFTPTASDADGDTLIFSADNLPGWASFNPASGAMTGVPGDDDAGTFSGITIMVSDGNATAAIAPFEITVATAGPPSELEISATLPATYVWDTLEELKPVYVDRQYTFVTIPTAYAGLDYLVTANDDKLETVDPFISFEVNRPVRVYVAYDARSTGLPSWLASWTSTGDAWVTTDTTLNVYARDFDAGGIGLGGNEGGQSMYSVAVALLDSPTLSANDDIAETRQDTPVSIDVLSNDSGLDNTPLQVAVVSAASNGTATATQSNTVYYIPASGYSGGDSFDYSVTDASGNSASATVTVTVTAASGNSQPTAFNDSYDMQQDAVLTMNVLDNDTGLFDEPVVVSVETTTGHGTVTTVSGNAIEFFPDDGYSGPDNFTYRVTDADGDFDTAQVSITVVQATSGSATLSWTPPTLSADGSPLNDLAGYWIYYGTSPDNYPNEIRVANPGLTTYVVEDLAPGTYHFVTTAYDTSDNESDYSNVAIKTIGAGR